MGGAVSASVSTSPTRRVTKEQLLPELLELIDFDQLCDKTDQSISLQDLQHALELKTDVFLTHNWGTQADDYANHKKVALINAGLKKRGLTTWFDDERMEGAVTAKMCEGIDNTRCVAVFITKLYEAKVTGPNPNDNCKLEFGYATRKKTSAKMVPVVMEGDMWNARHRKPVPGRQPGGCLVP